MRAFLLAWLAIQGCHRTPSVKAPPDALESEAIDVLPNESAEVEAKISPVSDSNPQESEGGKDESPAHAFGQNRRGANRGRDYAIRVGMGFRPDELLLLERAVGAWASATGLPLHLRYGYGPLGNFHIAESIPVCGQRWVYDGYLGCYSPDFDTVVLNRYGIELEMQKDPRLLYIVFVHELGHFLGLLHAEPGEDSIMLKDYETLLRRQDELSAVSVRDIAAVCALNPCKR